MRKVAKSTWVSRAEAAKLLHTSPTGVLRWDGRKLDVVLDETGRVMYRREQVLQLADARRKRRAGNHIRGVKPGAVLKRRRRRLDLEDVDTIFAELEASVFSDAR